MAATAPEVMSARPHGRALPHLLCAGGGGGRFGQNRCERYDPTMPLTPSSTAAWLLAVGVLLASCDLPTKVRTIEREAAAIADAVAPNALSVTGSRSNRMRDSGRTVLLDYGLDGYAFAVSLDLGPLGCKTQAGGCEAALRRQIRLGRDGWDAERFLAPRIAACELDLRDDERRVRVRARSVEPLIRDVQIELEGRTPLPDQGAPGLDTGEACVDTILAAHASGPFADLKAWVNLTLQPAIPFPTPGVVEEEDEREARPHYTLSAGSNWSGGWAVQLPLSWEHALSLAWADRAQAALDSAGMPLVVSRGPVVGSVRPLAGDRSRWVVHLAAAESGTDGTGDRGRPDHVVRLIHDARSDRTQAECVVRDVRDPQGRLIWSKVEGPCTEAIGPV